LRYPATLRTLHLALATLCLAAWGTGQFADDYKRAVHPGFSIHEIVGIGFAIALAIRVVIGLTGPARGRFATWFPFGKENLRLVVDDLKGFARLRFPEREPHEGVAGLVQFLGLVAFALIAATGTVIAIYLEPGTRATGWLHDVKEIHEAAQVLIPIYLGLHVGGALVHALLGQHLWREMFFLGKSR
jgi:cytochrome b